MKNSKFAGILAVAALVGVLGVAGAAFAATDATAEAQQGGENYAGMTDAQWGEMRQLHKDLYGKMMPLRQQMMAKRAELEALYYANSKDNAKIQALFREMADLKFQMFTLRAELSDQLEAKGIYEPGMRGMGGYGMSGGCGMMGGERGWHDGYGGGKHRGDMRRGGHGGGHGGWHGGYDR